MSSLTNGFNIVTIYEIFMHVYSIEKLWKNNYIKKIDIIMYIAKCIIYY